MEKKRASYIWKLSIVGMLLIIIVFVIAGGGHGRLEPFFIVFPYSFLVANHLTEAIWLMILLMFIQYPIYGYLLDKNRNQLKRTTLIIAIIHIVFAIIAFQNMDAGFK